MGAGMATGRTGEPGCTARLVVPEPHVPATGEAFAVPTDVTYTALGFDRRLLGVPYSGAWLVASRALSYDFLWNEVRVKGGAYGAGFSPTRTATCASTRIATRMSTRPSSASARQARGFPISARVNRRWTATSSRPLRASTHH